MPKLLTTLCSTARRNVTLKYQREQAKAMQRFFQQQKAAEIADRSKCACWTLTPNPEPVMSKPNSAAGMHTAKAY